MPLYGQWKANIQGSTKSGCCAGPKPFVTDPVHVGADEVLAKDSAQSNAVIYGLIETAKENGLNPYAYLTDPPTQAS